MSDHVTPVLTTHDLAIGFSSKHAIANGLNLSVDSGDLVFLLGPNGVGKTTLLKTLAGLHSAIHGRIELNGVPLPSIRRDTLAKRRSIVLTQQSAASSLRAREIVSLGRLPYASWSGSMNAGDEEIVERAMSMTSCSTLANRLVSELSDGERQKVFIARAIAQDTPIIMLDEPTAFIDLPRRVEIMQLLRRLTREFHKAVILSTHDLDLALMAADRIWLLGSGGTFATGLPEELVLSGDLKRSFHSADILFDESTGRFAWNNESGEVIDVQGEGLLANWTKRALVRLGYRIGSNSLKMVLISSSPPTWTYTSAQNSHSFPSLAELANHLRCR